MATLDMVKRSAMILCESRHIILFYLTNTRVQNNKELINYLRV